MAAVESAAPAAGSVRPGRDAAFRGRLLRASYILKSGDGRQQRNLDTIGTLDDLLDQLVRGARVH